MPDYGTTVKTLVDTCYKLMQDDGRFRDLPADVYHMDATRAELNQTHVLTNLDDYSIEAVGGGNELSLVMLKTEIVFLDPERTQLERLFQLIEAFRSLLHGKERLNGLAQVQYANFIRARTDRAMLEQGIFSAAEITWHVRLSKTIP